MSKKNTKYQITILTISIIFWIYLLGINYISPLNIEWLSSGDLSTYQLGWQYFREDIWRFPLGINPNYGIYSDSNIIYSDSVPLFAITFKLFDTFLPSKFQYFSLWILTCIYLQLLLSYKILFIKSNDERFSFIGSLFFLTSTIFLHRLGIHLSLMAHWIILFGIFIEISSPNKKNLYRLVIVSLSITIHFYFTLILLILFSVNDLLKVIENRNLLLIKFKNLVLLLILSITLMYILGYFSIKLDDGLGWGYGYYNLNLNSFFNPGGFNNNLDFSWSNFLKPLNYQNGEIEGFSYLGISGIIFFVLFLINLFNKKYLIFYNSKGWVFLILPFLLISISNNINFGETNLMYVELNKYIYAVTSIFRASGRMIWPIYYFIFLVGIIFIFNFFKSKSSLILSILFIFQLFDIQSGIKNYQMGSQYYESSQKISSKFWNNLSSQFDNIFLLETKNQSEIYHKFSGYLLNEKFKKTDLVNLARINRDKTVSANYSIVDKMKNQEIDVFNNSIFLSDNYNYVSYIKYLFKNKIYIYLRDGIWLISGEKIKLLDNDDSELVYTSKTKLSNNNLEFNNNLFLPAIGWNISKNIKGYELDGYYGAILISLPDLDCFKLNKIKFKLDKFYEKKNESINFSISEGQNIRRFDTNNLEDVVIEINCRKNNTYNFEFKIDNPLSKFDLREGLNRNKKSFTLKSISILK